MRFFLPVLVAVAALSSADAVALTHKPQAAKPVHAAKPVKPMAPAMVQTVKVPTLPPPTKAPPGGKVLDVTGTLPQGGQVLDVNGDLDDQYNMTPYVRQMANGQWEGGVPNYEDPAAPMWTRQFSAEGEAKAWAYSKTGAADTIQYEQADGADGDEDVIDQIVKEGRSTNNSNFKANEHNENAEGGTAPGMEKPIIDATGGDHLGQTVYHTSAAHSTRETEDNKKLAKAAAERAAFQAKHGKRISGTHDKTKSKEVLKAEQQAKKAKKNAIWTKSVSARNHHNGGNDRLTKKQLKKTQGAKDAKDKRAVKLTKLGSGKHKIKNSAGNARRAADLKY